VYTAAARALEQLCTPGLAFQAHCDTATSHILDKVAIEYRRNMDDYTSVVTDSGPEVSHEDRADALQASLGQLAALLPHHNMSAYNLWSSLLEICGWDDAEEENIVPALACCHLLLLWELGPDRRPKTRERPGEVQERLVAFAGVCEVAVEQRSAGATGAFTGLCSLLLLTGNAEGGVTLPVTRELVETMAAFLKDQLDDADGETITEMGEKREMLEGFCKLVTNHVIPAKCFATILSRVLIHQERFGDIIKGCLDEVRASSRPLCGRLMVEALAAGLAQLEAPDRATREFAALRELARWLALCLGVEPVRNREAVAGLHRAGIELAARGAAHPALLELLREFSGRLVTEDRKVGRLSLALVHRV
jgi:cohesin complex subunit SA-3